MQLFIVGLRRSGTTIVWKSFRADARLRCYDEPFNPLLRELPGVERKGIRDEFIALLRRDPRRFWELFSPIDRVGELQEWLSDRQRSYLRYLLESARNVVIDTTRCHFKLATLHESAPDACVVHLLRPAAAWVSSHLGPRVQGAWGRARTWAGRRTFFERRGGFNRWGVEEIIGASPESLFAQRLVEAGLDREAIYALPAAGRLLAYWKIHRDRVEADGRRIFGNRFLTLSFSEFCRNPADALRRTYALAGLDAPDPGNLPVVHAPRGAYRPGDPRWLHLARQVGLDAEADLLF